MSMLEVMDAAVRERADTVRTRCTEDQLLIEVDVGARPVRVSVLQPEEGWLLFVSPLHLFGEGEDLDPDMLPGVFEASGAMGWCRAALDELGLWLQLSLPVTAPRDGPRAAVLYDTFVCGLTGLVEGDLSGLQPPPPQRTGPLDALLETCRTENGWSLAPAEDFEGWTVALEEGEAMLALDPAGTTLTVFATVLAVDAAALPPDEIRRLLRHNHDLDHGRLLLLPEQCLALVSEVPLWGLTASVLDAYLSSFEADHALARDLLVTG